MRTKFVVSQDLTDAYDVRVQVKPRARWHTIGVICRCASAPGLKPAWNALAPGFTMWTPFRPTRKAALADMLAGLTEREGVTG